MRNVLVWSAALALVVTLTVVGAQAPVTTWDGVYTEEQAARGAEVYGRECASCHGAGLTGGEAAPALVGVVFSSTWEGVPLADLFERMRSSMPQTKPGSLSRRDNADLLAHILHVSEFPAGTAELDGRALGHIIYRTYRP